MWLYHRVMSPNDADGMANGVDPDQENLIWVCTVRPGISVRKLRIITVPPQMTILCTVIPQINSLGSKEFEQITQFYWVGWLCWGLTSQSTIFQSCRDGAIASWVINQYFRGVKCLAQGHNTAAVGLEPRTSRSGVRHSTTEPPRSPILLSVHELHMFNFYTCM